MRSKEFNAFLFSIVLLTTIPFLSGCRQTGSASSRNDTSASSCDSASEFMVTSTLDGYLADTVPADFCFKDRLYIGGENNYYLIDTDGSLVRWGSNWDNWDTGWDQGGYEDILLQPFSQRNVLVQHAIKYVRSYSASFALDENHNLWAWSGSSAWPLSPTESNIPSNEPRIVMSSVADIAASDFDVAVVMEDSTLRLWGSDSRLQNPVDIVDDVQKVIHSRDGYYFIDMAGALYKIDYNPDSGTSAYIEPQRYPLESDVVDVADADDPFVGDLLVLKKGGELELLNTQTYTPKITQLTNQAICINGSGFVSSDGNYWRVMIDAGKYKSMKEEKNTVWIVCNFEGDSILITKDGKIKVQNNSDSK